MKKIILVILVIISLFTTIAIAELNEPSYMTYSLSTMKFIGEIKDRMTALDEKENPTDLDVELCLQYTEMYARLMNLSAIEIAGVTSKTAPELGSYDELIDTLDMIRKMYDMGLKSADEVIAGLVEGIVGE